jgi:hypothetical protein
MTSVIANVLEVKKEIKKQIQKQIQIDRRVGWYSPDT